MFAKRLIIVNGDIAVRDIVFKKGLNLIVNELKTDLKTESGNSVGKTTIIKLIDVCFGADPKIIYTDENEKGVDKTVLNYLVKNKIKVYLYVGDSFENSENDIIIGRNFLNGKSALRQINNINYTKDEFKEKLKKIFFSDLEDSKPTFRQLISHNIRYKEYSLNNIIKSIEPYTKNSEYEALYLYMFGFNNINSARKIELNDLIKQENNFKKRIEKKESKNSLETKLAYINSQINEMESNLSSLHVDNGIEENILKIDNLKYEISRLYTQNSNIQIRKNLILDSIEQIKNDKAEIDIESINQIYKDTVKLRVEITKSFNDLLAFHNSMIENKTKFFSQQLPELDEAINENYKKIEKLNLEKDKLSNIIKFSRTIEQLNKLSSEIAVKYQQKGEIEIKISQINECESNLNTYKDEYKNVSSSIYDDETFKILKDRINEFNSIFSSYSKKFYDEEYILVPEISKDKNTSNDCIVFKTTSPNMGSGKKQGEALAFDLAYLEFAKKYNVPHFDFLLNDKKELMHENQLLTLNDYCESKDVQIIIPILKDKLPIILKDSNNIILSLNQDDKLFRIESEMFDHKLEQ